MENNSPQGMKVPLIVTGVGVVVVVAGVLVRLYNPSSSPPSPEPTATAVTAVAEEAAAEPTPEPVTAPAPPREPSPRIKFSSLAATDKNGDSWTLGLAGVPRQAPESGVKPGVPLVVKADVLGRGRTISIGLIIEGQAGEVYESGAAKNGRRRPAPAFKILDEAGKVLGSGRFEYG